MRINVKLGTLALSIYLILAGLVHFGLSFSNEGTILAILAIVAGVLLLVGK